MWIRLPEKQLDVIRASEVLVVFEPTRALAIQANAAALNFRCQSVILEIGASRLGDRSVLGFPEDGEESPDSAGQCAG